MQRQDIDFDESDKNLFLVDDARLRADALRHSVLPRMHVVMNETIAGIKRVYDVEALDDSIVSHYPHFRPKRENELKLLYESAFIGLGGKRTKNKWHGVARKDGKPVQILPFRFGFELTEEGLNLTMHNYWLKGLTDASCRKYLDFHLEFEGLTHSLCYLSGMQPALYYGEGLAPITTFSQHYQYMAKKRHFGNHFFSQHPKTLPISPESLDLLMWHYIVFFPIYDSYIQISKGESVRFVELISKLNRLLIENEDDAEDSAGAHPVVSAEALLRVREAAEQRIKVMPALRWQVFQRDNWRCVACGRGAQDGIILHVDHIVPRSKGGADTLDNYQTLCDLCNLGKSNRDATDLRA
ncbi:MAG: HNH endonuclease [Gammaproteobacteria bacterium]